jgi:high-affinity nickel permease
VGLFFSLSHATVVFVMAFLVAIGARSSSPAWVSDDSNVHQTLGVIKVFYNLTTTGLSVAVALIIGGIELISVLHDKAGLADPVTTWITEINLDDIGYAIATLFVLVWAGPCAPRHRREPRSGRRQHPAGLRRDESDLVRADRRLERVCQS